MFKIVDSVSNLKRWTKETDENGPKFRLSVIILSTYNVFNTFKIPTNGHVLSSSLLTYSITAVRDIIITTPRSWNCQFRGHLKITPSLMSYVNDLNTVLFHYSDPRCSLNSHFTVLFPPKSVKQWISCVLKIPNRV